MLTPTLQERQLWWVDSKGSTVLNCSSMLTQIVHINQGGLFQQRNSHQSASPAIGRFTDQCYGFLINDLTQPPQEVSNQ